MEGRLRSPEPSPGEVDWNSPWLAPMRQAGAQIALTPDWRSALNQAAAAMGLVNLNDRPVSFVAQDQLPAGLAYEAYIHATGMIPTRNNLHDFFNGLVWLHWPRSKARLNALQMAQIERLGIGKARGPARDAATLLDENAAILAVRDNPTGHLLMQALQQHAWLELFLTRREQFQAHVQVILFGHALMEKLARPYKAITAHCLIVWMPDQIAAMPDGAQRSWIDRAVAERLASDDWLPSGFAPMPVLGVPGWWPNQDIQFYSDASVFRPERRRSV